MNVLVIGGGGREHAIVTALAKSPKITQLYAAPGNGGIAALAQCIPLAATDIAGVVNFAKESAIDFVVVAPDDPLALGMVDALTVAGIPAFGPTAAAAEIEGSKAFAKDLMQKHNIPTARYQVFHDDADAAIAYVREQGAPIVVKCDGLALGKGVVVAETTQQAEAAVLSMMRDRQFGDSGRVVVIEECLDGPEVTVLAFTDGKTILPMLASQDYKRVFAGNNGRGQGPNTGGMGAICPSPRYSDVLAQDCMEKIYRPTVAAMEAEGRRFKGVLYFGLMLTKEGAKVIEYNARFGDPETQAILPLLDTDLLEIFEAVVNETLHDIALNWKSGAACCVAMASGGYPLAYENGKQIQGLNTVPADITVYHAGTQLQDGNYYTAGGRVLGITATDDKLDLAIRRAYEGVACISFEGAHYRDDIGQ